MRRTMWAVALCCVAGLGMFASSAKGWPGCGGGPGDPSYCPAECACDTRCASQYETCGARCGDNPVCLDSCYAVEAGCFDGCDGLCEDMTAPKAPNSTPKPKPHHYLKTTTVTLSCMYPPMSGGGNMFCFINGQYIVVPSAAAITTPPKSKAKPKAH
jgi:hypothetical protein